MEEARIWAYHLLEDVRKDAIKKARGKEVTKQVYATIIQILKLAELARKEGLLELYGLQEEGGNTQYEPELRSMHILCFGIDCMIFELDDAKFTEILVTKYWVKDPQGMEALAYYICILGLVKIRDCECNLYMHEKLLTALLPEGCMEEYEKEKEKRMPKRVPKTMLEELLERECKKLPRSVAIIRNVLEEKIETVTNAIIKAGVQKSMKADADGNYNTFAVAAALRGLNRQYKEKLLFCVSSTCRNKIVEDEKYMGPIRIEDLGDALVSLLECFEEAEREGVCEGR